MEVRVPDRLPDKDPDQRTGDHVRAVGDRGLPTSAAGDEQQFEDKPFSFDPADLEEEDVVEEWKTLAESGDLPAAVVEYIRGHDGTTIPQLQALFADFTSTRGEQGLALRADPNLIIWLGLSPEFAGEIVKLIGNRRLYLRVLGR